MSCPTARHNCDVKTHRQDLPWCNQMHPEGLARCTRLMVPDGPLSDWHGGTLALGDDPVLPHDGDHAGFGFSVTQLVTWPK